MEWLWRPDVFSHLKNSTARFWTASKILSKQYYNKYYHLMHFFLWGPVTWPANNCREIMVCLLVTYSLNAFCCKIHVSNNILLIQSYLFVTTLLIKKWQIAFLSSQIVVWRWKQTCWVNDTAILVNLVIALYHDLSVSYTSADHWQITVFYLASPLIIVRFVPAKMKT